MTNRCEQNKHRWVDDGPVKSEASDDVQPRICQDCNAKKNFVVALQSSEVSRTGLLKWAIPVLLIGLIVYVVKHG